MSPHSSGFPAVTLVLGLECKHWPLRSDVTMSQSQNGETLSHRWWQQVDGHQCAAGRLGSKSCPGIRPHALFSVGRQPEAPDSNLCPSKLGSCKSSHQQENTSGDGARLVLGQVTLVCRKVIPGGETLKHLQGLIRMQSTATHMMKDTALEAVLSCHP